MERKSGWSIDVKSCSTPELVEVLKQLEGSEHSDTQIGIRSELVLRARNRGLNTSQIIDSLIGQVPRGRERNNIAKEWAESLGITVEEFKRLASGK